MSHWVEFNGTLYNLDGYIRIFLMRSKKIRLWKKVDNKEILEEFKFNSQKGAEIFFSIVREKLLD